MFFPFSNLLIWLALLALPSIGFCYSLISFSSFPLSSHHLVEYFGGGTNSSIELQIIESIRMPRALVGLVIGANLAIAGVIMQGLTRNALASPAILGINSGAACLMALAGIGFAGLDLLPGLAVAALGGIVSSIVVMLLGGVLDDRPNPVKLILAGIAINALLIAITRAAVIIADDKAFTVISWLAGSLANADWRQWHMLWPVSLVGHGIALVIARQLNLLTLGNEKAVSLGINLSLTRVLACAAIVLLTAASVSISGPIGFVGLLIPHMVRKIVGHNYLLLIPASALAGGGLILFSDAVSRSLSYPAETPVGVLTALVGTPVFILLAIQGAKR